MEMVPIHNKITGWNKLIFCLIATTVSATTVSRKCGDHEGIKILVGSLDLRIALCAMILTGIIVRPRCMQYHEHYLALEAVSGTWVEFLQTFHGFKTEWCGGIIQSQ
ncbi:MAG: hypothetical protein WDM78_06205 [Puia sp.]